MIVSWLVAISDWYLYGWLRVVIEVESDCLVSDGDTSNIVRAHSHVRSVKCLVSDTSEFLCFRDFQADSVTSFTA
jgi:hypothetical protein